MSASTYRYHFLFLLLFLASCGLRYEPVKTPRQLNDERRDAVENQLRTDFSSRKMAYTSLGFAATITVKPASCYKLDSLYGIKYELEKQNLQDKRLEERIHYQKLLVDRDTTTVYYIEDHVFGLESVEKYEGFHAKVYVDLNNKIQTIDIIESDIIEKKLASFYAAFVLRSSFLVPGEQADAAEMAFYEFYSQYLDRLVNSSERRDFLNFTLNLMKIAYRGSNLDKSFLIEEMVRFYAQGTERNYLDEKFSGMEELYNEQNEIVCYQVNYTCSEKDAGNTLVLSTYSFRLDPYLQLLEKKKL